MMFTDWFIHENGRAPYYRRFMIEGKVGLCVSMESAEQFREDLLEWSRDNQREFPWRDPSISMYEMLMSEFFLSRTRAEVVARVMPEFFEEFPDLQALREAEEGEIAEVIRPTGLQNRRAKALTEIAEVLDEDVPGDVDELKSLPRVGEYVAHATLCFGRGEPLFIRDTNVVRIYNRILGDEWPDGDAEQAKLLQQIIPEDEPRRYNLALLDFGAEICTAQSPRCKECFAGEYCDYYESEREEV